MKGVGGGKGGYIGFSVREGVARDGLMSSSGGRSDLVGEGEPESEVGRPSLIFGRAILWCSFL